MKTSRLENESAKAHAAFLRYAEMGPEKRSIREVARQLRKSSTMIGRWSRRHKWTKRVAEWDASAEARLREAEDRAMKQASAAWAKRQIEHREEWWQRTCKLIAKFEQMADMPITEKIVSVDGKAVTVKPGKWTFGDVVRGLKELNQIQRLLLGLSTEKTEITGPDNSPVVAQIAQVIFEVPPNGR